MAKTGCADMLVPYALRLFLEYARVMSPDRDHNNFET